MRPIRHAWVRPAVLALLLAGCSPATATPTQTAQATTVTPTQTAQATTVTPTQTAQATPTAGATVTAQPTASPTPKPTPLQKPPAPTNFIATPRSVGQACPSPDAALMCTAVDLTWQSTADGTAWFRIYMAGTGEGDATCQDVQAEEVMVLQTAPGARIGLIYRGHATGGGSMCLWITAVNAAGESAQVPAAGQ